MVLECGNCGNPLTAHQLPRGAGGLRCPNCGTTVPIFDQNTLVSGNVGSVQTLTPPTELQVEGYEILGRLGEGGMGIVYLARQLSLDRKVAIKVMSPVLFEDPSFVARFDREIAALVRLSHPHIVTIFDRGRSASSHLYYVMEYVEGKDGGAPMDLDRLMAQGRLDSSRVRELMLQVVQAIGFAHRQGIIHRDIKPSNILIDQHGFAKVVDFGIASMRADRAIRHVTAANQSVGTAAYMSPEQQRDAGSVDHRSDIYASGIMLYQMLTGQLPLAGYEPPSRIVAGLSSQWDAIVATALQPRPENRFPDMQALEAVLREVGQTSSGTSPTVQAVRAVVPPPPPPATSAVRPPATASQPSLRRRADLIAKSRQLAMQGHWQQAIDLLTKAADFSQDDGEMVALVTHYRECAEFVQQAPSRIAALASQNRWCEVSQLLADLQRIGVSIKGLDQYAAAAQQRLAAAQQLAATAREFLKQDQVDEALAHAKRALQYASDYAEALKITDSMRRRITRSRRVRGFVLGLVGVACLAAIIIGASLYLAESGRIDKAKQQIQKGDYDGAARTVEELPHRFFYDREATYWQAVAEVKQSAAAKQINADALLQTATRRLKDLFEASESWRARAKSDLADTVAQVPSDAADALNRALRTAQALHDLQLMEPATAADSLVKVAEGRSRIQSPPLEAAHSDYVKQVLAWDPARARTLVGLAIPKEGSVQQGLAAIRRWSEETKSLAGPLSAAVVQVADDLVERKRYQEADDLAKGVSQIDSRFDRWGFWAKRFDNTARNHPEGACEILSRMVEGERDSNRLEQAADWYFALEKEHPGALPPPPDNLRDVLERREFTTLIGDAERLVKDSNFEDARQKLDDARRRFPGRWDDKGERLRQEVELQHALWIARKLFEKGDFDAAANEVKRALQFRPDDRGALALRDGIQASQNQARAKGHLAKAKDAIEKNADVAVEEVKKAYEVLQKAPDAEWTPALKKEVDALVNDLTGSLCDRAKELSDTKTKQYKRAEDVVESALTLPISDNDKQRLSDMLVEIRKRAADPKTANITGEWQAESMAIIRLDDNGSDTIRFTAVKLPAAMRSCRGEWTRKGGDKGDQLEGRFEVVFAEAPQQKTEGTVGGRVVSPGTLEVFWQDLTWIDRPRNGTWTWRGKGKGNWTKISESQTAPAVPKPAGPLAGGVVVGDYCIAIVRPIKRHADTAEITLGVRRIGDRLKDNRDLRLNVYDDRPHPNKYSSRSFGFDRYDALDGIPPSLEQLPIGFTWTVKVEVGIPEIAPIAWIELADSWSVFTDRPGRRLDFGSPVFPSLDPQSPAGHLLDPGATRRLNGNLVAKFGQLKADRSSAGEDSVSLSLPITVVNEDYNPHRSTSFRLFVQSEDGEVRLYTYWEAEEVPGKKAQELTAAVPRGVSPRLDAKGLRNVLLYRGDSGIFSRLQFVGFIPIPDDIRQRSVGSGSQPSPLTTEGIAPQLQPSRESHPGEAKYSSKNNSPLPQGMAWSRWPMPRLAGEGQGVREWCIRITQLFLDGY